MESETKHDRFAITHKSQTAKNVQKIEFFVSGVLSAIAVTLICISSFLACLSVLLRYGFSISYSVIEEICRYAIVYAVMLYFGPLITRNAHLTMSLLTDLIKPKALRYFDLILYIVLTIVLFVAFIGAFQWESNLYSMGLQTMSGFMKAWLPSAALPIGLFIATCYSAVRVYYRYVDLPLINLGVSE
ncbi:TRAP transporter small permease subunit [Alcaligenaceae bacterium]|nr:TRAP transporter small permease subunit [Alcaligenaceae bacterium]